MSRVVKIGISLPEEVLEAAERERQVRGETRGKFFCGAVESLLRRERQRHAVQRYIQGYQEQPETEEEVAEAHREGSAVIGQEPWEWDRPRSPKTAFADGSQP